MKTFTATERDAAYAAIEKVPYAILEKMPSSQIADIVMEAINNAEGMPVGSGDKYTDAKDDLVQKIKHLNKSVSDANVLGLTVNIVDTNGTPAYLPGPAMPMPALYPPPAIAPMPTAIGKPQFKLTKLSKEFPIV